MRDANYYSTAILLRNSRERLAPSTATCPSSSAFFAARLPTSLANPRGSEGISAEIIGRIASRALAFFVPEVHP